MKKYLLGLYAMMPLVAHAATIDGATLSPLWGIPFAALLLSIAIFPLIAPSFWHAHFGKIAAIWALAFLVPFAWVYGPGDAAGLIVHALIAEYIPFIALLAALYTVAGGICLHGKLRGGPVLNTAILALGALLASLMGTTGAAMLLIRPLLRANEGRRHVVHVVVFFIFIVANVGGSLTPLGDPPLFLGFLKGVGFLWTTQHLLLPMLLACAMLLIVFYGLDAYLYRRHDGQFAARQAHRAEPPGRPAHVVDASRNQAHLPTQSLASTVVLAEAGTLARSPLVQLPHEASRLRLDGKRNFWLLGAVIALVLMSGFWRPGVQFDVMGTPLALQDALRDVLLFVVLAISLKITPDSARGGNQFEWAPILEVAKLFAAIFLAIAPVITILSAGAKGAFAPLLAMVTNSEGQPINAVYFWATGILSGFLDNAPTYLVFFNTAGGDAATLMTHGVVTLTAISAGAVFMGGLSYIGNAPNFMVKAIAEERGIPMPSFFGYMLWSVPILLPVFAVVSWIFF
jgi:Na+/H+ antiporter NhaD/arsenite permease-like protein